MNDYPLVHSDDDLVLFNRFGKWSCGHDHAQIVSPTGARAHIGREPGQFISMFSADLLSLVFPDNSYFVPWQGGNVLAQLCKKSVKC